MKWNFPLSRLIVKICLWIIFVSLGIWCAGVAFYCLGLGVWGLLLYLAAIGTGVYFYKNKYSWYGMSSLMLFLVILPLCMRPSNNRVWQASWSQMPLGTINGNTLTIQNVRDFNYRSTDDYDVRYVTKTFDLDKLVALDFAASHWDGIEAVSHTLLTFGFSDGQHLALSAETRLDQSDTQSAVAGLFNQFELLFIFATENDLFGLRTNYRHEDLFLYRTTLTDPGKLRSILLDFVDRANELHQKPQFYNTITNNCTTALRGTLEKYITMPASRYNIGSILNGYIDQKAFDQGLLLHRKGETFPELKQRSLIPHDTSKNTPEQFSSSLRNIILTREP